MKAKTWFYAQGARMAGMGRMLQESPLWAHRNQLPTFAWMAFTKGYEDNKRKA